MPLTKFIKVFVLLTSIVTISGCWHELKYGPQYVHPVQPKYEYLLTEPLTTIYGSRFELFGAHSEISAALAPNGEQYFQIKVHRKRGRPSEMLFLNTPNNRKDLTNLFNQAYQLLTQANELGMEFGTRSLGCLGPKHNQPDCRDRGAAFYDGQIHLLIQREGIAAATFRAVGDNYGSDRLVDLMIFDLKQLKKMQTAMDAAPLAFETLQKKHSGFVAKTAI